MQDKAFAHASLTPQSDWKTTVPECIFVCVCTSFHPGRPLQNASQTDAALR